MGKQASDPSAHTALVRSKLVAEFRRQDALLGNDLEAGDVGHVGGRPGEGHPRPQLAGIGHEQQQQAEVHGIAREAVDAVRDQHRCAIGFDRVDRGAGLPETGEGGQRNNGTQVHAEIDGGQAQHIDGIRQGLRAGQQPHASGDRDGHKRGGDSGF